MLLATVTRTDTGTQPAGLVPGPARTYNFTYASASVAGTTLSAAQVADLYQRYNQYFARTTGCSFVSYDKCGNPLVPGFMPHPTEEVHRRVDAFLSDVADNLLTISGPNETVETRYEVNPLSFQFDKVTAQRWGTSTVAGMPSTAPNWTTTLPEATFAYADESPTGTDAFLEADLRSRYGYEITPAGIISEASRKFLNLPANFQGSINKHLGTLLIGGTPAGNVPACKPEDEPKERTRLPGYRHTYDYYALPLATPPAAGPLTDGLVTAGVDLDMPLQRSRLNCAQLAETQTFDVEHNDLQTWMTGRIGTSGTLYNFESFAGRRAEMNLNANRICAWTKMTDREGQLHVYGFNYHGRTLVSATKVNGTWKVAETLYNADGNVIAQRRVTSGATAWTPNDGDTRYGYIDGERVNGPNGPVFKEPAAFYWAQRRNVRAILERPRGGSVTDEVEGTSATETTLGRYTTLEYEPLFGQVSWVVQGDVVGGAVPQRRPRLTTRNYYDYQECTISTPDCLGELLKDAQKWGAQYPVNAAGTVNLTGNPLSVLIGAGDLNGDQRTGFPVRGSLVRTDSIAGNSIETTLYRFSAHGRPYFIQTPDGTVTALDYRVMGATSGAVGQDHRGWLGRVRVMRNRELSAAYGPPAAPCPHLDGPYQWLLPATCGNSDLQAQLRTLTGMSSDAASEIVRQSLDPAAEAAITTLFEYTIIGAPARIVRADGSESRFIRDVDGRVREQSLYDSPTQLHSREVFTRNVDGLPTRIQRYDRNGVAIGAVVQTWDEQGELRFRCAEVVAGGCDGIPHGSIPPHGSSETFWYDREGRLKIAMDPEGALVTYARDARGWVTSVTQSATGEISRLTAFTLNDDGAWLTRSRGAVGSGSILTETRTYDGLRRLSSVTDSQGRFSTVRHTARDVLGSVSTAGAWTVRYVRDEYARVTERWTNGQRTVRYKRLPGGRVWSRHQLGQEPEYFTHDEFGQVVFARQGGVTTVSLSPVDRRFSATVQLRNERSIGATTFERTYDVLGELLSEREVGYDGTSSPPMRSSTFARDDNGYLTGATDPQGATSEFVHDLLGRVVTQRLPVNGGALKTTTYTWDRRGALLTRTDPRGATHGQTAQAYTGYGEPRLRTVPGGTTAAPQDVVATWTYDAVGRLKTESMGAASLKYEYLNNRVHRVFRNNTETVLRQYGYDSLGRLASATHYNVGLLGMVPDPERTVVTGIGYDTLGRRSLETIQVGTRALRTTTSTWTVAGGAWLRESSRPDGQTAREQYDGLGRLAELERPWSGNVSKWRYNGGLVDQEEHLNASTALLKANTFDGFSQLRAFDWVQGSQRPYESSFLRDKMGRVVSANRTFTKAGHTSDKAWRGYKYQQSGALEVVFEGDNFAATGGRDPTDTTWAEVEAMAPAVPAARFEYTRDIEGSPLAVQRVDIPGQSPRFHAPPRDRGFQAEWVELDGARKTLVKHDSAGRVTEEFGRTNTWDDFHSLVTVEQGASHRQAFQYDGLGRLVAARSGPGWDVQEEVAYDGAQMVAAWNQAGSLTWSAVWGPGLDNLVAVRPTTDGSEAFALKDGKGSVVGYYHADGTTPGLVVTADYTPEGRMKSKEWSTSTTCEETGLSQCGRLGGLPFGFHSAYKSPVHGLLYFRNRWYSAESGQWLSHDPLGEVDSANLYAFNGFDPINHRDPLGTEKKGFVGDPGGRDPRDPQLDGGATMVVSAEPHVDDSFLDQMACQYLNDCKTNNLATLEDKHAGSRPRNVSDDSSPSSRGPSLATPGGGGRSSLVIVSIMDALLAQVAGSSPFRFANQNDLERILSKGDIDDLELLRENDDEQWFPFTERDERFRRQVEKAATKALELMKKAGYKGKMEKLKKTVFWKVQGKEAGGGSGLGGLGSLNVGLNPDGLTGSDATPTWFTALPGERPSWLPDWQLWKTTEAIVHEWLHHVGGEVSNHERGDAVYRETDRVMGPYPEPGRSGGPE